MATYSFPMAPVPRGMIKNKKMMIQLSRGCLNSEPEGQEIKHEEDNGREEEADIRIMKEKE